MSNSNGNNSFSLFQIMKKTRRMVDKTEKRCPFLPWVINFRIVKFLLQCSSVFCALTYRVKFFFRKRKGKRRSSEVTLLSAMRFHGCKQWQKLMWQFHPINSTRLWDMFETICSFCNSAHLLFLSMWKTEIWQHLLEEVWWNTLEHPVTGYRCSSNASVPELKFFKRIFKD